MRQHVINSSRGMEIVSVSSARIFVGCEMRLGFVSENECYRFVEENPLCFNSLIFLIVFDKYINFYSG